MQQRLATAPNLQVPLLFSAHTGALAFFLHPWSPKTGELQVLHALAKQCSSDHAPRARWQASVLVQQLAAKSHTQWCAPESSTPRRSAGPTLEPAKMLQRHPERGYNTHSPTRHAARRTVVLVATAMTTQHPKCADTARARAPGAVAAQGGVPHGGAQRGSRQGSPRPRRNRSLLLLLLLAALVAAAALLCPANVHEDLLVSSRVSLSLDTHKHNNKRQKQPMRCIILLSHSTYSCCSGAMADKKTWHRLLATGISLQPTLVKRRAGH